MLAEFNVHVLRAVLDRADVVERLGDAFRLEPLEALGLNLDQIGSIHDVRNLSEASAIPIKAGGSGFFTFGHEAFPPFENRSVIHAFCEKSQFSRILARESEVKKNFYEIWFICMFLHAFYGR
jgi:hypothetical protein